MKGITPKTPFQKACEKLRLAKINTIEKANEFLQKEYLPKINKKFVIEPLYSQDGHAPCPIKELLADIFCYEEQRVVRDYRYEV